MLTNEKKKSDIRTGIRPPRGSDNRVIRIIGDRINETLLYYGISGPILHWLTAFLTDRTQCVLLDGSSSDTLTVSSGVPQGTVLGPLLFLIYINDLSLSTRNSSTRLFADDSLLYRAVKTLDDCRLLQ